MTATANLVPLLENPLYPVNSPVIAGTNDGTILTDSPFDGSPGDDTYIEVVAYPNTNDSDQVYVTITAPPAGSEIAGMDVFDDPTVTQQPFGGWPYLRVKFMTGGNNDYHDVQTLHIVVYSAADDGDRSNLWWRIDFEVAHDWREGIQTDITLDLHADYISFGGPGFASGFDYEAFARDVNGGFVGVEVYNATSAFPDVYAPHANSAQLRVMYLRLFAYSLQTAGLPVADFTWVLDASGRLVHFDASPSTGDIVSYDWAWDDQVLVPTPAQPTSGESLDHQYYSLGPFDVTLTVTDTNGQTASATQTVDLTPSAISGGYVSDRCAFSGAS